MAERYPEVPLPRPVDPIEARINEKFNQLIDCLNRRRVQLIAEHRERQAEKRAKTTSRVQTLGQLTDTKTLLQAQMKENLLHSMRDKMVEDIETKMRQLEVVEREVELTFECDTRQLEETISVLGQLVEREILPIPNYPALLEPRISVGKIGTGQGELYYTHGIAFDERTQLIYVANRTPLSCIASISVFSVTGEYINTFCQGLMCPIGIALNGDEVYVSDSLLNSIFHFKLPGFELITKVGMEGTGKGEFSYPRQLTVAPNGSVFVADTNNNRIVVMTQKLEFLKTIEHTSMTVPCDVKLLDNKVFVLSCSDNPCLHVFSQTGEKLRSFITRGRQGNKQVKEVNFFCFDKQQNILISDWADNSIKVFSQEGALLHTLGYTQEEEKRITPTGIVVTNDSKIICSSYDTKFYLNTRFGLHIFC